MDRKITTYLVYNLGIPGYLELEVRDDPFPLASVLVTSSASLRLDRRGAELALEKVNKHGAVLIPGSCAKFHLCVVVYGVDLAPLAVCDQFLINTP